METALTERMGDAVSAWIAEKAAEDACVVRHALAEAELVGVRERLDRAGRRVVECVQPLRAMEERHYWHGRLVIRLRRHEGATVVTVIEPR